MSKHRTPFRQALTREMNEGLRRDPSGPALMEATTETGRMDDALEDQLARRAAWHALTSWLPEALEYDGMVGNANRLREATNWQDADEAVQEAFLVFLREAPLHMEAARSIAQGNGRDPGSPGDGRQETGRKTRGPGTDGRGHLHAGLRAGRGRPGDGRREPQPAGGIPEAAGGNGTRRTGGREIMPEVRIPAMDDTQRDRFQQALQEILLANADGMCRLVPEQRPDGATGLRRKVSARGYRADAVNNAIDLVEEELLAGRAVITNQRPDGRTSHTPMIQEAEIIKHHHYPVDHMDDLQEEEFNRDVQSINQAMTRGHCSFESILDDEARIYFRYRIADHLEEAQKLLDSIHRVIDHVHSGRALRIEMPGGSVMLMPRWRTGEPGGEATGG